MSYTRREFAKVALAGVPAAIVLGRAESIFGAFVRPSRLAGATAGQPQSKPNSLINGVQIGAITYSYRSMPDQSAEATLKYILDSGLSAVELMDGPAENFAGAPSGRGAAPGGAPGGARGAGARGGGGAAASGTPELREGEKLGSWNGQPCVIAAPGGAARGGGGGRGRGQATPEQQAAQEERARTLKEWRTSVSMDRFKQLRKMYNDAGVTIYAYKSDGMQKNMQTSDAEFDYLFNVASALGASHTTMELPGGADADAMLKRMAQFAEKYKVAVAYHTHAQGSMTAFDQAFAISKWNLSNVDFGHYVAAGNVGGTPAQFLEKHHDRIASFHLKDRTTPEHCSLNLPWGTGETPIKEILQLVKKNKWKIPASIEFEYSVPEGSDAVQEVRKCLDYCRSALTS
jgi:sugar phosphate isomerase/epimerase